MYGYLFHTFPGYFSQRVIRFSWFAIMLTLPFVVDNLFLIETFIITVVISALIVLDILRGIIKAFFNDEQDIRYICTAGIIGFFGHFHDFFVVGRILPWEVFISHYSVVAFIFVQNLILGRRFSRAFRQAQYLSKNLQKEVKIQTSEIRAILENLETGIFLIERNTISEDPPLIVGDHVSPTVKRIFGRELRPGEDAPTTLLEHSQMESDLKAKTNSLLSVLLDGNILAWDFNHRSLPREMELAVAGETKIIEVDWSPVFETTQSLEKIVVSLRDVTKKRLQQTEEVKRIKELSLVHEIISMPAHTFNQFMETSLGLKQEIDLALTKTQESEIDLKLISRHLHTLKGFSRMHSLSLSSIIHETETELKKDNPLTQRIKQLKADLQRMSEQLNEYQRVEKNILQRQKSQPRKGEILLTKKDIANYLNLFESLDLSNISDKDKPYLKNLVNIMKKANSWTLEDVIEQQIASLAQFAHEAGKPTPKLQIDDLGFSIEPFSHLSLQTTFTHLLRNCLEHGIETAEERKGTEKPEYGTIMIKIRGDQNSLIISLEDDGIGIDLNKIRDRAKTLNLLPEEIDDDRIGNLIFANGFSTKNEITENSGMGVGLDSVKSALNEIGGDIKVKLSGTTDSQVKPFRFEIILPKNSYRKSSE